MNIPQTIIRIGQTDTEMVSLSDIENVNQFYLEERRIPNTVIQGLTDYELVYLFIGMIQLEKVVSCQEFLKIQLLQSYQLLEEKGLDNHHMIANWGFQQSKIIHEVLSTNEIKGTSSIYDIKRTPWVPIDEVLNFYTDYSHTEKLFLFSGRICPYCGNATTLIDSSEIYGTSYGPIYICRPCNAYVGCYKGTHTALGRLANQELREAKKKAHHYFDQLWKPQVQKRPLEYLWLSQQLGIPKEFTHIGMSNTNQCNHIIELSRNKLLSIGKQPVEYE